jgi:catechol 2,3-dioxygenase-like lactoylglutathione lyase family enzyme
MVMPRVSLITIGAENLPDLRKFYQSLGWTETVNSSDIYCVFETAGVLLSLYPIGELAADSGLELLDKKAGISGITLSINVDTPEQVDQTVAGIEAAGGRIVRAASEAVWGGRIAYFLDPENNLWEIAWNPTAKFDERGAMLTF